MPRQPSGTTYTKTLSALRKTELVRLANDLDLDSDGSVAELRTRLKDHLNENRDILFRIPRYNALYPRHRCHIQPPPPPASDTLSTHLSQPPSTSFSSWDGMAADHHQSPPPVSDHTRHPTPVIADIISERNSPVPQTGTIDGRKSLVPPSIKILFIVLYNFAYS
ncbi:hypothetical protein BYT27DRAFT_7192077 [Phlegmacium glaucopus]|nr:hypothetical protein BYT27DRAFT_7192077 [Phlegmacium glaucopus]